MSVVERIGVRVENAVMGLARVRYAVEKPRYFHKGEPNEKVADFPSIVAGAVTQSFNIENVDEHYWEVDCCFKGKEGKEERQTRVFRQNGFETKKPTIIWHHGAGNVNYEWQMRYFLNQKMFDRFNVFSVKAAHHEDKKDYLANCMDSFEHWQMTFAGSVLAEQEVVNILRQLGEQLIIITGGSMGGIVASWHWLLYNSADYYFPMVAYPNVGAIFMGDVYKKAVDRRDERLKNPGYFEAFLSVPRAEQNLTAILGELDTIISPDQSLVYWHEHNSKIYPLGHASIALRAKEIRRMMLKFIG